MSTSLNIPTGFIRWPGVSIGGTNTVSSRPAAPTGSTILQMATMCDADRQAMAFTSDGKMYAFVPPRSHSSWMTGASTDLYIKDDLSNENRFLPLSGRSLLPNVYYPPPFPVTGSTDDAVQRDQLDGAWLLVNILYFPNYLGGAAGNGYMTYSIESARIALTNVRTFATPVLLRWIFANTYHMFINNDTDARLYQIYHGVTNDNLAISPGNVGNDQWNVSYSGGSYTIQRACCGGGLSVWEQYDQLEAKNGVNAQVNEIIIPPNHKRMQDYIQNGPGASHCCAGLAGYSTVLNGRCSTYSYSPGSQTQSASAQCISLMNTQCDAGNNITLPECRAWCQTSSPNCNTFINDYCGSLSAANALLDPMCACFMPGAFMTAFYNSLTAQLPSGLGQTLVRNPRCAYQACTASSWKPYETQPQQCQNFQFCYQEVNLDVSGAINGNVGIKQGNDCNFNAAELGTSTSTSLATSTATATATATSTATSTATATTTGTSSSSPVVPIVVALLLVGLVMGGIAMARARAARAAL